MNIVPNPQSLNADLGYVIKYQYSRNSFFEQTEFK